MRPAVGGPGSRRSHSRWRRGLTAAITAVTAAGGLTLAAPVVPAAFAAPAAVTVTPNPAYAGPAFTGWGTSLVWFANATGQYPDALRNDLVDKVFGADGLNLNLARYNVGGGSASDVDTSYFRKGGAVPGWWNPSATVTDANGVVSPTLANRARYLAAWNADDPASYDLNADAGQRWWVSAIKDKVDTWEAFSNSPPWFMTQNGYVSEGFNASTDQIDPAAVDKFATYMKTVVQNLEQTAGISVHSIDPVNEPNTPYWGTYTDAAGKPTCCRQEGAHAGPSSQAAIFTALDQQLAAAGTTTRAVVSGPDETNPSTFLADWYGWTDAARAAVDQLNVHTYSQGSSIGVRDVSRSSGKPLWMSEVEGNWGGNTWNPASIDNGIGLAQHITGDLRNLDPSAWTFWQPVEDFYNMQRTDKSNWGSVYVDFDCDANGNSTRRVAAGEADPTCRVEINSKYNTTRNFTHYIRPGDHIVPNSDDNTTAAVKADGSGAVLVHTNAGSEAENVTVDLSRFGTIAPGATVTPVVTTESPADAPTANALVKGTPVAVDANSRAAMLTVPAKSVTTFVVDGVSGVAADAALPQAGQSFQLVGQQSAKALTATGDTAAPLTITTPTTAGASAAAQRWTFTPVADPTPTQTSDQRYVLTSGDGRVLAGTSSGPVLQTRTAADAASDRAAQWILSTTDGKRVSLVNVGQTQALDVARASTAENAPVGIYGSNGAANQSFTLRAITAPTGITPVAVATLPGQAPALPATVTPVYAAGPGNPVAVTWNTAGLDFSKAGVVTVPGSATDGFGAAVPSVVATVEIGQFTSTDPVSVTVAPGASAAAVIAGLPKTVPARIGSGSNGFPTAVTWDTTPVTDAALAAAGRITVTGTATSNVDGAPALPARLTVLITAGVAQNFATDGSVTPSATFTESGYSVANTINGNSSDKAWSNWVSGTQRGGDTLTYTFGERTIRSTTLTFFRDGGNISWATSGRVEYRTPAGDWVVGPAGTITTTVPTSGTPTISTDLGGVRATGVRFVLTAPSFMTVSEVEITAVTAAPASAADAALIRVNGTAIAPFDPSVTDWSVAVDDPATAVVGAIAVDSAAKVTVSPVTGGVATVQITSADGAVSKTYTVTVRQRTSAPVTVDLTAAQPVSADGWYRGPVTATLSTTTAGAVVEYKLDGGAWTAASSPVTITGDGTHELKYHALVDGVPADDSQGTATVRLDSAAPVTSVTVDPAGGAAVGRISATFAATDAGSGVRTSEYAVNGAAWQALPADGVVRFDQPGSYAVKYRSTDKAGNVEADQSVTLTVTPQATAGVSITSSDNTPLGSWYTQPVIVALSAPSGSKAVVQYRIDGGTWKKYSSAFTISANGAHVVEHRLLVDNVVQSDSTAQFPVKIDRTAPTVSATRTPSSGNGSPRNPITINATGADAVSGIADVQYKLNDGSWQSTGGTPLVLRTVGTTLVSVRSVDVAGNTSSVRTLSVTIVADPATTVKPSTRTVTAGQNLTLSLTGFARWDDVTVSLGGAELTRVVTDQNGAAKVTVVVPSGTAAGVTALDAVGSDGTLKATASVTVRR